MNHQMLRHICAFLLPFTALLAQQNRLASQIDSLHMVKLPNSVPPEARRQYDRGPVDPSTRLGRITLLAKRTPGQQADLEELLNRQQIPSSPDYHRWLTPAQFAGRFGLSETDIGKTAAWLASQGFHIEELAQARNWIACSGTAQQVAHTFGATIHRYEVNGEPHFANATEVFIPEALDGVIGAIQGLHDFNPKPVGDFGKWAPAFSLTQITTGSHALTPADFATVYDVNPLYAGGIDGTGIQLVVVGASEIRLSDIDSFRGGFHLPASDPQLLLIGPSPGTPQAEEGEALLDLEWAGAVAPNASLIYVYSANLTDGLLAAIDRDLAPIISTSYADCEAAGFFGFDRSAAQQANAEGITWLSASGDSGAAGCDPSGAYSNPPAQRGLAVNQPASFPEVTAVGGTQFAGDVSALWTTSSSSLTGYSAISYIPETGWNETTADELVATGGGASMLFAKPEWQTGAGVPDDNARDVPDVSLAASSNSYVTYWGGFNFTGGGTSASTPSFAGVVALLNQYLVQNGVQAQPGLGNINPALYQIAKTVPSAFHDITTGTNIVPCAPGSLDCATGFLGFSAGVGYDPVTGLGSIDANQLITHWTNPAAATVTKLAVPSSITLGDSAHLTATVAAVSAGSPAPSGTVNFTCGSATLGSSPLTASGATAIATLDADGSQLPVGADTINATYTGDGTFSNSMASAAITVNPQTSTPGSSVFVSVTPNPDHAGQPLTLTLTEEAGVATTLTTFTENGADLSAEITSIFGTARIPAFGRLSASGISPPEPVLPATIVANLGGMDDSGRQWSRQVSVTILSPLQGPAMALSSASGVVQQNAAAASCQWSQQLLLQEQNGFPVQLTGLKAGAADLSAQVDPLFGTSHLAPFGTLQATICQTGLTPPQTLDYEIDGTDQYGSPVSTTLHASFTGPASSPATLSASPLDAIVGVPDAGGSATGSLTVSTAASWTVSVFPSNATTTWLTVSPLSGTGPALLSLTANASALRDGVYRATLILQGTDTLPQFLEVPVTLEAGVSQSMSIDGVTNAASYQLAVAPGMMATVFGSQLAPEPVVATSLPLPLQTEDVAVTVNGVAAPLLYISPTQLNIQIPYETGAGPAVLGVNFNGQVTIHEFTVTPTAPGIYAAAGALVPIATGKPGDTLPLFMTGEGDVSPFFGTNVTPPASTPLNQLPKPVFPVTVTVGGMPATIQFMGIPSGLLGTQINFTIPLGAAPGVQPLVVTVNGVASPPVNLTVEP